MAVVAKPKLNLERLVRANILSLKPYRCARDDYSTGVLLDANECAFGSSIDLEGDNHRYPCPYQLEIKQKIAEFRNVKKEQIFLGVGSDEAIDMIMRVFCIPGEDSIMITPPTYGMYKVVANINNLHVISVPLTDQFQLPVEKVLNALTPKTKVIYLCSPNNPTANRLATEDILAILNSSYEGIVAVDEAYVDFSETPSLCYLLKDHPQLIILQTMSKAFGLAGIRFGMAFAHEDIIEIFNRVKFPYSINKLTSKIAYNAFSDTEGMKKNVRKILEERKRVLNELKKLPFVRKIFPSDANFLLVRIDHAYNLYKTMANKGVVTRYRGDQVGCDSCIRVTIGTPEENTLLLEMIRTTFKEITNSNTLKNGV